MVADGPGYTYELLSTDLGGIAQEAPDCLHEAFGRHIEEVWDEELGKYVFEFYLHAATDGDLCSRAEGAQRNEVRVTEASPSAFKGYRGDVMAYRWKFRLDRYFQPSAVFTYLHRLRISGLPQETPPLLALGARRGKLQILYSPPGGVPIEVASAPLEPFKGRWVEAVERVRYSKKGSFSLTLRRVKDGAVMLSWTSGVADAWRARADFVTPHWGLCRSLQDAPTLHDETLRYADLCIGRGRSACGP